MVDMKNLEKLDENKIYLGGVKQPDGTYINIIIDGDKIKRIPYCKNIYHGFAISKKNNFTEYNHDRAIRKLYVAGDENLRCRRGFKSSTHTNITWIKNFIMKHESIETVDDYRYEFQCDELGIRDLYYCVNRIVERYSGPEIAPRIYSKEIVNHVFVKFFIKKDISLDRDALIEYIMNNQSEFASMAFSIIQYGDSSHYYYGVPEHMDCLRDDNVLEIAFLEESVGTKKKW